MLSPLRAVLNMVALTAAASALASSPRPLNLGELYWLLHRACGSGDDRSVEILLKAGADPTGIRGYAEFHKHLDPTGTEPIWPLAQAAWGGHVKIVRVLLKAGADPNAQFSEHLTALTQAAGGGHLDVVRVLLAAGADPNHRSDLGTAAELALKNGHSEIAQLLQSQR
jgi:ankyrin repeat protein